jgi:hypothetical protein
VSPVQPTPSRESAPSKRLFPLYPVGLPAGMSRDGEEVLNSLLLKAGLEITQAQIPPEMTIEYALESDYLHKLQRQIIVLYPDVRLTAIIPLLNQPEQFEKMLDKIEVFGLGHADDALEVGTEVHFSVDRVDARHILLVDDDDDPYATAQRFELVSQYGGVFNGSLGMGGVLLTSIGPLFTLSIPPAVEHDMVERLKRFLFSEGPVIESGVLRRTHSGRLKQASMRPRSNEQKQEPLFPEEEKTHPGLVARTSIFPAVGLPEQPPPSRPHPSFPDGPTIEIEGEMPVGPLPVARVQPAPRPRLPELKLEELSSLGHPKPVPPSSPVSPGSYRSHALKSERLNASRTADHQSTVRLQRKSSGEVEAPPVSEDPETLRRPPTAGQRSPPSPPPPRPYRGAPPPPKPTKKPR